MILRRIAEGIRNQDWFVVTVEILTVVIGIFIGLQVDDWNEERKERVREHNILEQLTNELKTNLARTRAMANYYSIVRESAEEAIKQLVATEPEPEQMIIHAFRASEGMFYPTAQGAWDEIVSAGEMSLLPSSELRNEINLYFSADYASRLAPYILNASYRVRIRRLLPHVIQERFRTKCGDEITESDGEQIITIKPSCNLDLSDKELADVAETLVDDSELLQDLRYHVSILETAKGTFTYQVIVLEDIIENLTQYIDAAN